MYSVVKMKQMSVGTNLKQTSCKLSPVNMNRRISEERNSQPSIIL